MGRTESVFTIASEPPFTPLDQAREAIMTITSALSANNFLNFQPLPAFILIMTTD